MSKKKITISKNQPSVTASIEEIMPNSRLSTVQLVGILLVCFLTFLLFSTGFNHQFVEWDDQLYVRDNPLVNNPTWDNFFKTFRTSVALNYHPITIISLWINAKLSGVESAKAFIVTNSLIHSINVLLIFWLAYKLSTKQYWTAIVTAALFAVHPMKVESVIWVSERKDVLYALFFLLSTLSYLRYVESHHKKHILYCFLFFLLSCLSKGQAVVLPVVLLLIDFYKNNLTRKVIIEKLPFLIVSILFGLIALDIQAGGNFYGFTYVNLNQKTALNLKIFSVSDRLVYAGYSFMNYIKNFVIPQNLSPFHPYLDFATPGGSRYYLGLPFTMIVAVLVAISSKKTKLFVFGIGFYAITVALVLQFISVGATIVSDRYSYLPYFGLTFIVGMLINKFFGHQNMTISILAKVLTLGVVLIWAFQTKNQIKIWENSVSLFTRMIEVYPDDYRPYSTRGKLVGMSGDLESGIKDLEKSVALGAKDASVYSDLGTAYAMKGQIDKAIVNFTKSIDIGDKSGESYLNRGIALMNSNPVVSITDFEKALTLLPAREIDIRNNMAILYNNQNKFDLALTNINRAIELGSKNPQLFKIRASIYEDSGNIKAALADYEQLLTLEPTNESIKQRIQLLKN